MDAKIDVVSGESLGFPKSKIMLKYENGDHKSFDVRGHWLYVRKCKRAEDIEGILIPDKSRDDTVFALVLAIGSDCGKPLSKKDREIYDSRCASINTDDLKIYDKVMCPDDHHVGIKRSLWGEEEFFIHELIVKCVVEN